MYKKILVGGLTAAAIVGAGGTALAVSGSDTTGGANTTSTTSTHAKATHAKAKHPKKGGLLRRLEHGQFVTRAKTGTVTHDLIRGTVTAVSATSITVQAQDKTSETFVVGKDSTVRVRTNGKGAASTIAKVAKGDHVFVAGTGTTTLTAKHVVAVSK